MPPSPETDARTLIVWCPDWPVVAAAEHLDLGDKPVAVFDKGEVYACSASARAEGVRRGHRIREAQSRCPDLVTLPHDPALATRAFEPVISTIEGIAPGVQLVQPGTCALRARGPSRYFGSEEQAVTAIQLLLRRLDVPDHRFTTPRFGVADGAFAAEQAARASTDDDPVSVVPAGASASFLSGLSVGVLGQPELAGLLRRLGIVTLGDFAQLSARDVLGRFGPVGAHAHRLASGGGSGSVVARRPPPELTVWTDLDAPAERVDQVAFGVRQAAERFVAALAAEGLVCTSLRVQVVAEDGPGLERCWLHPRWFTAADIVDRVRWQLQGDGQSDTGLRSPVTRVGLVPDEVDPVGAHADSLFGGGPDEKVHRALSRVQSMLGHGEVVTVAVGGGRSPADRQTLVPWGDPQTPQRPDSLPWVGRLPDPPPSTVFPEPRPAAVLTGDRLPVTLDDRGVLNGPPALFCPQAPAAGAAPLQPVDAWAGPWPVSERWWDDSAARRLARFQVVGADGSAWLLVVSDGRWWTEARYD